MKTFKQYKEDKNESYRSQIFALKTVLQEAKLQIEYLHEKFGETGSGNQVLAQIEAALDK